MGHARRPVLAKLQISKLRERWSAEGRAAPTAGCSLDGASGRVRLSGTIAERSSACFGRLLDRVLETRGSGSAAVVHGQSGRFVEDAPAAVMIDVGVQRTNDI